MVSNWIKGPNDLVVGNHLGDGGDIKVWLCGELIVGKILQCFDIIAKHSGLILSCGLIVMILEKQLIVEEHNDQKANEESNTRSLEDDQLHVVVKLLFVTLSNGISKFERLTIVGKCCLRVVAIVWC